jgi:hypothetical protein
MQIVTDFYNNAILPKDINKTFLALITKKSTLIVPQDLRPISLCNVSYKIIAKSLANIIKEHLPDLIHPSQSAFVQGRHIATIIIITQEIIHSFHLKNCTSRAFLLKVDLAKAFDRISWTFTSQVLKKYQFSDHFMHLVYACISTTSMQVLVNGKLYEYIYPSRGIR